MRIAVDARTIFSPSPRGIGKTLLQLYRSASTRQPNWEFILYHRDENPDIIPKLNPNMIPKSIQIPGDRFDAWHQIRLPFAAWSDKADLLHCPANTCPKIKSLPTAVTIHDLIPHDRPHTFPPALVKRFRSSIQRARTHADAIITPSQYTKNRLICDFDIQPHHIFVNPWAPSPDITFWDPQQRSQILKSLQLDHKPYVLHFGAKDERKNTDNLLNAWAMSDRQLHARFDLCIIGVDEQTQAQFIEKTKRLGIANSVYIQSYLPQNFLSAILSGASLLVYPSHSEGFGLPILDGWATRTPVITSRLTSLPEIGKDAVLYVDPQDPCSITRAIRRALTQPLLRQELIQAGLKHLSATTWSHAGERLISIFQHITDKQMPTHRRAA